MLDSFTHLPANATVPSHSHEGRRKYLERTNPSLRGRMFGESSEAFHTENKILNGLPASTLAALWPSLRRIEVEREQFLFQQDEDVRYLYFPETAVISELHMLADGRMVEVAIMGREGSIGITSLYYASRTSNCVQATQAGRLMRIESCLLRKQCKLDLQLPSLLHSALEGYIRHISQRSVCNKYHSIEERLCTWLLLVCDLGGKTQMKLTHEQIGRALGVHRPGITTLALELKRKNIIDYRRGVISIVDRAVLEAAACGCFPELRSRAAKVSA